MSEGTAWALLAQVKKFLMDGMPLTAIAHSYHVDALLIPDVGGNQAFQHFSLIELNELHHQVAALGAVLRAEKGEQGALHDVALNLSGFLENREAGLKAAPALPSEIQRNPLIQKIMGLIQQTQVQVNQNLPILNRVIALAGSPSPGPLLVHCPGASPGGVWGPYQQYAYE